MKHVIALVAIAGLLAACGPRVKEDETLMRDLIGGSVPLVIDAMRQHNGPVRLVDTYVSAATLWSGHPAACYEDTVKLIVHPPYNGIFSVPLGREEHERMIELMASIYPEPIKSEFREKYAEPRLFQAHDWLVYEVADLVGSPTLSHCDDTLWVRGSPDWVPPPSILDNMPIATGLDEDR